MIDEILRQECDEKKIRKLHNNIVVAGKHSKKLIRNAKIRGKKKNDRKYYDPEYMEKTGSIKEDEAVFLYKFVKYVNPKNNILEIGTWFGTSAVVMAEALRDIGSDKKVYTCDKYDLLVVNDEKIVYRNVMSDVFINTLMSEGIKFDMIFIDAEFAKSDYENVISLINPLVLIIHDYETGEKGWRNIVHLKEKTGKDYKIYTYGIYGIINDKI